MLNSTLLLGDCREELGCIASESVDLIVTSSPYANQRFSTYGGVKPDDYVEWFLPVADELQRVLKPSGTFILNIKDEPYYEELRQKLDQEFQNLRLAI